MTTRPEYGFEKEIQGEVASILSFWPMVRDDSDLGPDEALQVLATWSHLKRFPPNALDQAVVDELDALVLQDASKLLSCFSCLSFVEDWIDEAEQLDESWDWIADDDAADQANLVAMRLFQTLDQFSLACYAGRRLLGIEAEDARRADLDALEGEVAEAEQFLSEHPDTLLGAAGLTSARLGRYREDLLECDERLWETTLKHRVLEELLEERATVRAPQALTRMELETLLAVAGVPAEAPARSHPPLASLLPASSGLPIEKDLSEHLDGCGRCSWIAHVLRADSGMRELLGRWSRAVDTFGGKLVAAVDRTAMLARPTTSFAGELRPIASARSGFQLDDEQTSGVLYWSRSSDSRGPEADLELWLGLESPASSDDVLLQVVLLTETELLWNGFVMLHEDYKARTGKVRLPESAWAGGLPEILPVVRRVPATSLGAEDVERLLASYEQARRDDPDAVGAWKNWASDRPEMTAALPASLRVALEGISEAGLRRPPIPAGG
jgi:hypothetical protein